MSERRVVVGDRVRVFHGRYEHYAKLIAINPDNIILEFSLGHSLTVQKSTIKRIDVWGPSSVGGTHYHTAGCDCEDWLEASLE